jgi:glutamine synthetase
VEERGLENLRTSADALPVLQRPDIRDLFERQGVLSPVELESRFEVYAEQYVLAIEVEARLVLRIARTQIYPVVMEFLGRLARSLRDQVDLGLPPDRSFAGAVATLNHRLLEGCTALEGALAQAPHDSHGHLRHCADTLMPLMGEVRAAADGLEALVDDDLWPLPTYQELLFVR